MFHWLIRLILDTVILAALVLIFGQNRLRQAPRAVVIGLGVALTWLVCGWMFGWLIVLPLAVLTGAVLMVFARLPLKRAALAAMIFLVLRLVLGTIVPWLL
jgi:hypothetical protein